MGTMEEPEIRDVWAENLDEEMAHIRDIVEDYPYIAMVLHPPPNHKNHPICSFFPF